MAARHLLHLQPRRVRAGHGDGAGGGQAAPHQGRAAAGGSEPPPGHRREPDHRRVPAQPDDLPGARHGRGPAPRRRSPERQAAHRARLRARALQGGLRHRDHVARYPHAGEERRPPVADQADRPGVPEPHPQRADPDGGPRGPTRHRSRGQVRDGAGRPRRARGHAAGRGRAARAHREPVQARLRVGGAPAVDRPGPGDDPADGGVLLRPVPESQEDPRARDRGQGSRARARRCARLSRALRRLLAHRPLPDAARRGGGGADGARTRRPAGTLGRRGRARSARPRATEERRDARPHLAAVIAPCCRCSCPTAPPSR